MTKLRCVLCTTPAEEAAQALPNGDLEAPTVDSAQGLANEYLLGLDGAMSVKEAEKHGREWRAKPKTSKAGSTTAWNALWAKRNSFYKELDKGGADRERAVAKLQELIDGHLQSVHPQPGADPPTGQRKRSKKKESLRGRDVMCTCLGKFLTHMQAVSKGSAQPAGAVGAAGAAAEAAPAAADELMADAAPDEAVNTEQQGQRRPAPSDTSSTPAKSARRSLQ